jgi:hypothetical protein
MRGSSRLGGTALSLLLLTSVGCASLSVGSVGIVGDVPEPSQAGDRQLTRVADGTLSWVDFPDAAERDLWASRLSGVGTALEADEVVVPAKDWDGSITLRLPETNARFQELTGKSASEFQAATYCQGQGSIIAVSPTMAYADDSEINAMLLHEGVHAVTMSACTDSGPDWLNEGLAEWVAVQHVASTAAANREVMENYLADNPVPESLPDFDSPPDGSRWLAVVQSQYVVAAVAARLQGPELREFLARIADEPPSQGPEDSKDQRQALSWYRDYLKGFTEDTE